MKYTITLSDNSTQLNLYDLEQNGLGNISTPRLIKRVVLTGGSGFNYFEVIGDLSYRFISWFTFTVTGSVNAGTFTVAPPGATYDSTHNVTKIPVVEVISIDRPPYGSITYTIPSGVSLALTGRGSMNFAPAFASSVVHRLENFASSIAPTAPIKGQRWYDTSTKTMRTWDGSSFAGNVIITADSALYLTDPQNPTNPTTQVSFSGNDAISPDVGVAVRTLVNPNAQDSIFRILTSTGVEALRVEHAGHLTTSYTFKQTGSAANEFSSDASFVTNAKGIKTANNSITSNATGTSWSVIGDVTANIVSVNSSTHQVGIGATISGTSAFQSGSANVSGTLNLTTHNIKNVQDPVNPQDVANKNYLNGLAAKLDVKNSVRLATTTVMPTYIASGAGVGKTLTGQFGGHLILDGVGVNANDRVLVKDEVGGSAVNGGVYSVFNPGVDGTAEITNVLTLADVPSSLGGKYFTLSSPINDYYVWLNATDTVSPSTNPGPIGSPNLKEIRVDFSKNDNADDVAAKTAAFIQHEPHYTSVSAGHLMAADYVWANNGGSSPTTICSWVSPTGSTFVYGQASDKTRTISQKGMLLSWEPTNLVTNTFRRGTFDFGYGVAFNPTMTKMYSYHHFIRRWCQYDLSEPGNVSSIVIPATGYSTEYVSPNISSVDNVLTSSDGTYFYTHYTSTVHSFVASTPWDVTTAVFLNTSTFDNFLRGVFFNSDGTKLYTISVPVSPTAIITQYSLSTPWNIETRVSDGKTYTIPTSFYTFYGAQFNGTGDILLIVEGSGLRRYNLSVPFDITTATPGTVNANPFTVIGEANTIIEFPGDGKYLYSLGTANGELVQHSIPAPWQLSTYNSIVGLNVLPTQTRAFKFDVTGKKLFALLSTGYLNSYNLSTPWMVSTATLEGVSPFSVGINSYAIAISPDGSTILAGNLLASNAVVNQYTLTTPWDVTTMVLVGTKTLNSVNQVVSEITANGKYLFLRTALTEGGLYRSTLSTPWNVTTAGPVELVWYSPSSTRAAFDTTGSFMYIAHSSVPSSWNKWQLQTPWDPQTTSRCRSINLCSPLLQNGYLYNWSADGTKIYVPARGISVSPYVEHASEIAEFTVATPWDITTIDETSHVQYDLPNGVFGLDAIILNPSKTRVWFYGQGSVHVLQYDLIVPGDFSTIDPTSLYMYRTPATGTGYWVSGWAGFDPTGMKFFIAHYYVVSSISLTTPWDLSSAVGSVTFNTGLSNTIGVTFSSDGLKMFIPDGSSSWSKIRVYVLTAPWDITTATTYTTSGTLASSLTTLQFSADGTKLISGIYGTSNIATFTLAAPWDVITPPISTVTYTSGVFSRGWEGIAPSHTGTDMYMLNGTTNSVYQFSVESPWNLGSMATGYSPKNLSLTAQDATMKHLAFSSDGSKMYALGSTSDRVYQYTLSTPGDITTAIYSSTYMSIGAQELLPTCVVFNPAGTLMFVSGGTKKIHVYSMSTPWDLATATYTSVFQEFSTNPRKICFSPTGSKLYISDAGYVFEYTLSAPWNITTASITSTVIITPRYPDIPSSVASGTIKHSGIFFDADGKEFFAHNAYDCAIRSFNTHTAVSQFSTSVSANTIIVTDAITGTAIDASAGTSGFVVNTTQQGTGSPNLGSPYLPEVTTITTTGDVTNELGNEYFLIDTPATDYFVWYNPDNFGTQPNVPGRTPIEVAISSGDSALTVATKTAAALPVGSFSSSVVGSPPSLVITNTITGAVPDAVDVSTGFTISTTQQGITGDSYVLIRSSDLDEASELTPGTLILVEEGTVNADSGWILVTNSPITMDTTPLTFMAFGGALLAFLNYDLQAGTGTAGYTTPFTFSNSNGGKTHLQVYVNGIRQKEGSAYTASAPNVVTFAVGSEPSVGADVEFYGFG